MELNGKICVVTGAASGIGAGLARRFVAEGARVVLSDVNIDQGQAVADQCGERAWFRGCDVSQESQIKALVNWTKGEVGPIDLFASNAGVLSIDSEQSDDSIWQRALDINVMSHVWAARHVVPHMIERGGGYLLNTASAAGLLNQPGTASYAVTKHAAVGFAEWLSLTYGDDGIRVSCLCPQAVETAMIQGLENSPAAMDGILSPDDVAAACVQAIADERFLILPHGSVRDYVKAKAEDHDRWLGGMRKLNRHFVREQNLGPTK